jgi:aerobic-type carbon monoxide dehydrogenase small subunit (CoxS/CutS family)
MAETIAFTLNDKPVSVTTDGQRPLLWVLRTDLGLTGTKFGCGQAHCGACTVLVDNKAVRSCVYPVRNANGRQVRTIEGLAKNGELHPLQKAFVEHDALQCGFCTPGMIMAAADLLQHNGDPSDAEIRHAIEGNICRCTGYHNIVLAVREAARIMRDGAAAPATA